MTTRTIKDKANDAAEAARVALDQSWGYFTPALPKVAPMPPAAEYFEYIAA